MGKKYRIESDTVTGLAVRLMYLMRLENEEEERKAKAEKKDAPRIDRLGVVGRDGSKLEIRLNRKKSADASCREGIEIDGARLA